jgi:hypothetical protein
MSRDERRLSERDRVNGPEPAGRSLSLEKTGTQPNTWAGHTDVLRGTLKLSESGPPAPPPGGGLILGSLGNLLVHVGYPSGS